MVCVAAILRTLLLLVAMLAVAAAIAAPLGLIETAIVLLICTGCFSWQRRRVRIQS